MSIPVFSSTEGAVGTNVTLSPTAEISPATVSAESSSTPLAEHSDLSSATSDGVHRYPRRNRKPREHLTKDRRLIVLGMFI